MRKIILSCTTTYERCHVFYYTLQSLVSQSLKPDIFLINISTAPYLLDSGFQALPHWIESYSSAIQWVPNTGPYRKLLPAIPHASPDDCIVTADDDILYGPKWLEQLITAAEANMSSVVCCRARQMQKNVFGNWQNYRNWKVVNQQHHGLDFLPTGGSGAVYRKRLLDTAFLTDPRCTEIAPTNDDLWFKMASLRQRTPVTVHPEIDTDNIYLKHSYGLEQKNFIRKTFASSMHKRLYRWYERRASYWGINQSQNDFAWDAIEEYARLNLSLIHI